MLIQYEMCGLKWMNFFKEFALYIPLEISMVEKFSTVNFFDNSCKTTHYIYMHVNMTVKVDVHYPIGEGGR